MATLDWYVTSDGGATFVSLLVTAERTARVRVENCLDGPVWPPRRQGVPEAGWDEDGFEGTVPAGERLVLGYASPADPAEPPVRLSSSATEAGQSDPAERPGQVSPREVIRTLGDPTPPRDAVPAGEEGGDETSVGDGNESPKRAGEAVRPGAAVEDWLDGVRDRVEAAEGLASVSSVEEATEAVASVGGTGDLATLRARLDEDRTRLERVAADSESLAARIERVEVPVETLQRLA
jgi:hypothetical protein